MADFAYGRETRTQGEVIDRVFVAGEEAEFVFGSGTQVFPNLPLAIYGTTAARVVSDANEKWFEFGFRIDTTLVGNAATGWTDAGNYLRLDAQWSPDLVNWSMGKFVPAPVPIVGLGDGSYEYWSRAINPVDAAVKSGMVRTSFGMPGLGNSIGSGDTRNNPFTALTVAGVSLALGGFPYTMPADAARMQTDLRAFYPLATVEASSATVWAITIPGVSQTTYQQFSKVFWPLYYVADMYGSLTVPVDGAWFAGEFVDASGVPLFFRAFGRLKISPGTRYDPYH